ncbi:hypothetical protein [Paraburkholderia graminis]|uniref:hypothetical protein n=1 Tax=Paraburkholderia graminis TaxID=60548 RepID=UPI0038BAC65C
MEDNNVPAAHLTTCANPDCTMTPHRRIAFVWLHFAVSAVPAAFRPSLVELDVPRNFSALTSEAVWRHAFLKETADVRK